MIQAKVISRRWPDDLEAALNDFLREQRFVVVESIKFSTIAPHACGDAVSYLVLVLYQVPEP